MAASRERYHNIGDTDIGKGHLLTFIYIAVTSSTHITHEKRLASTLHDRVGGVMRVLYL